MAKKYKKTKLSIDERIERSKFNYCKNLKWLLIAPVAIVLVGVVMLCTLGFNLGIDFTGGTMMKVCIDKDASYVLDEKDALDITKDMNKIETKIEKVLAGQGLKLSVIQKTTMNNEDASVLSIDAVSIRFQNSKGLEESQIEEENNIIRFELLKEFGFIDSNADIEDLESNENKGFVANESVTTATASAELMMKSFIALLVAVVLILIYVAVRFELTSGLAAILALFHDILVTASIVVIFRIQINVSFIAALITILGYSINNTIIIFDQMRQDIKAHKMAGEKFTNAQVANRAVKTTMTRSVLTTLTTLILILMVTIIGVADIREFALPIIFGILAGFYSSVFLTPGLWAIAYRPKKDKKKKASTTQTVEIVD